MEKLYTAVVSATGGRNGHVESPDKAINFDFRRPKEMGGEGGVFLNPELMFAAGYAACFDSALNRVTRLENIHTGITKVDCEVSLMKNEDGRYFIAVKLDVDVPGIEREMAEELVRKAELICPYANATRGNVQLALTVR